MQSTTEQAQNRKNHIPQCKINCNKTHQNGEKTQQQITQLCSKIKPIITAV